MYVWVFFSVLSPNICILQYTRCAHSPKHKNPYSSIQILCFPRVWIIIWNLKKILCKYSSLDLEHLYIVERFNYFTLMGQLHVRSSSSEEKSWIQLTGIQNVWPLHTLVQSISYNRKPELKQLVISRAWEHYGGEESKEM